MDPTKRWYCRIPSRGVLFRGSDCAQKKYSKYREACARIDCTFRDGVIERYGHCSDGLVGLVRLIAGAGQSEPWETDYSSAAPSRVTHVAQCVVFGAVMADAAMLDAALEMDAWGREQDADGRRV